MKECREIRILLSATCRLLKSPYILLFAGNLLGIFTKGASPPIIEPPRALMAHICSMEVQNPDINSGNIIKEFIETASKFIVTAIQWLTPGKESMLYPFVVAQTAVLFKNGYLFIKFFIEWLILISAGNSWMVVCIYKWVICVAVKAVAFQWQLLWLTCMNAGREGLSRRPKLNAGPKPGKSRVKMAMKWGFKANPDQHFGYLCTSSSHV